ncbi:MAG: bifunctional 4-hydroxy-2-oxoglutarate aldolase/2-dehydro-3-deoxy-phosphogluconate aldolase [Firmicutes bacterium]|nr:bifunctional 4-hydroxy-2-oxoglutarate aldolase/2-dehydro-3-deoxy-phosphogluconate aldolase [Bacillota bacterium]
MAHEPVFTRIFNCGLLPVIKLDRADDPLALCRALLSGGLDAAEITFRTDAATGAIAAVAEAMPEVLVGAGTVTSPELVRQAVSAGAKFIVSPGFNERVVECCLENGIPVLPGVSCPSDIEKALNYGLDTLKFFPAEASGGLKTLKALSAPYGGVMFVPTGGLEPSNIASYFEFDKVLACGGSWMVKEDLIKLRKFDEIEALTREAVRIMHGFRLSGVKARFGAGVAGAFGQILEDGDADEIRIKCNNARRARAYCERLGLETGGADALSFTVSRAGWDGKIIVSK